MPRRSVDCASIIHRFFVYVLFVYSFCPTHMVNHTPSLLLVLHVAECIKDTEGVVSEENTMLYALLNCLVSQSECCWMLLVNNLLGSNSSIQKSTLPFFPFCLLTIAGPVRLQILTATSVPFVCFCNVSSPHFFTINFYPDSKSPLSPHQTPTHLLTPYTPSLRHNLPSCFCLSLLVLHEVSQARDKNYT